MTTKPAKKVKTPAKRSFKERFDDLNAEDKRKLLQRIKALTGRSQRTIYRWMEGGSIPTLLEQQTIAQLFGTQTNQIF